MEVDLLSTVLNLHKQNKWQEIIALSLTENECDRRRLLWVWPSENNLEFIKKILAKCELAGIISIGCGSGLLEYFLEQYTGLPVIGYEVNEEWWLSKYSNPQFIKLRFPEQPPSPQVLPPHFALLFCYFNDGNAFRDYIQNFQGNCVIIIGPGYGAGRHTDPEPFAPNFGSNEWFLHQSQEVRDTKDFIAVYFRATI